MFVVSRRDVNYEFLAHYRPCIYGEKLFLERGSPFQLNQLSEHLYEKKLTPLPEPRADCFSYCPSLNKLTHLGKSKGPFHSAQNSGKFWLEIKWNRPFWFGLTGVFGTTLEGGGVCG